MQRSWIAAALLGVVLICGETRAGGKPASLPNHQPIECDCQEGGGQRPTGERPIGEEPSEPPHIDAVSPTVARFYVSFLLRQMSGVFAGETERPVAAAEKTTQAQRYFDLAEFYRRTNHLSAARFCYQRAHALLPTAALGRIAIERLTEIENRLREPEESDGDDQSRFRRMQDRTVPLGLVHVAY